MEISCISVSPQKPEIISIVDNITHLESLRKRQGKSAFRIYLGGFPSVSKLLVRGLNKVPHQDRKFICNWHEQDWNY